MAAASYRYHPVGDLEPQTEQADTLWPVRYLNRSNFPAGSAVPNSNGMPCRAPAECIGLAVRQVMTQPFRQPKQIIAHNLLMHSRDSSHSATVIVFRRSCWSDEPLSSLARRRLMIRSRRSAAGENWAHSSFCSSAEDSVPF